MFAVASRGHLPIIPVGRMPRRARRGERDAWVWCDTGEVSPKTRWYWLGLALVIVLIAIAGVAWHQLQPFSTARLLARLPTDNALVLAVDFRALRSAGILQMLVGMGGAEDGEYRDFMAKTGFHYQRDLDRALAAFAPTGKFFVLEGRFDWPRLRAYAEEQGGGCEGELCRMPGSVPERRISFFPLRSGVMALAVSQDASAALRLATPAPDAPALQPASPVWVSMPISMLRSGDNLPTGTRMFAHSLGEAESVTLAFAPEGKGLAARLDVLCRTEIDAADSAIELTRVTNLLRQLIARENRNPNPADLSGVLAAGSFRSDGKRVYGYWPIQRSFVENLFGGASQR